MSAVGQQPQPAAAEDLNSQIESLRADTRADKVAIITEAMKFTPQESSAFWPIYKKYESDLAKLNDGRVELIKSYAKKYTTPPTRMPSNLLNNRLISNNGAWI